MDIRHPARVVLLAGTAIALAAPAAALAQAVQPAPTQQIAQAQAAAPTGGALEDIVVTANKRAENLQQVPLSVSAVTSQELELRGISETNELSAIAPNVSVVGGTTNATAAVVSIRGIPSPADETQGFDSPIGLYLDGVYLARSSAASFEVADIERVEVLRGPQGTLFGRNTTGGAINFITRLPGEEPGVRLRLGVGNYNQRVGRIVLDTGDIGGVRASFAYLKKKRDGVVDNLLQPDRSLDPGGTDTDSFRAAVTAQVAPNVKLINIFDYTRINGVPAAQQLAQVGDGTFRPNVNIGGFTFAQVQPAPVGGYLASARVLQPGCGIRVQRPRLDQICLDTAAPSIDKLWGNLFRIEAEFGDVTVRSSTAFRGWRNTIRGSDLDGQGTLNGPLFSQATLFNGIPASLLQFIPTIPAAARPIIAGSPVPTVNQPLFSATNVRRQNQFSQELEIVSDSDGAFNWVLGAFFFRESGYERNDQTFGFVLDTNTIFLGNFGPLGPSFVAANPARYRIVPTPSTVLGYTARGRSIAVYGQAEYRPGGKDGPFGVTLGLRYTWDRKNVDRFQNGPAPFTDPVDIALNRRSASFSKPTGNLTFDYRAADDVNLYARIARGYRSGGFNLRQTTSAAANIGLIPFNAETIWSYEAGAKTQLFDRLRLNGAVFYNVYSNQLATIPIPGGATFGTQVVNAGKTNYFGAELESELALNEYLSLDGSFGYIDIKPKEFPGTDITGATRNIASVISPAYAPKYTVNVGATLRYPIGDNTLSGRIGYNYTSEQVLFSNPLTAPFQTATNADARGLLDAQLRFDLARPFGVGKSLGITVFGKNLTNKSYVVRSVDFGQLGFAGVIYGDPRTYGVTLDLAF